MKNKPILYVAAPYAHSQAEVREHRFRQACRAAAKLIEANIVVFSPLSHSVPIAEFLDEKPHEFWMHQDTAILDLCSELLIVGLDGWQQSAGVKEEMFFALKKNMPITLIEEADIDNLPLIPKGARQFLKSAIFLDP